MSALAEAQRRMGFKHGTALLVSTELRSPISWGVLLQEAQNVRTIATAPWLLAWPAGAVVLTVLAYNFLGDGLRDAADPYK